MNKLTRADLLSLEQYAEQRDDFRRKIMAHKARRRLPLGEHAALYFEDRLTVQYQVQEMLRIEKIFEAAGINEELEVYNPLIPDGRNWKATFMLEYADVTERKAALAQLIGIEEAVWLQVEGCARITPISNEDLDRSAPDKTASVHFMRFELSPAMATAVKAGAAILAGIDHPHYQVDCRVPDQVAAALGADLDG